LGELLFCAATPKARTPITNDSNDFFSPHFKNLRWFQDKKYWPPMFKDLYSREAKMNIIAKFFLGFSNSMKAGGDESFLMALLYL
jgi:hypothetical protein